jgi:hypothetical protein
MNEFLIGFKGGQVVRMTTSDGETLIESFVKGLEADSTTPGRLTVRWHRGPNYLFNLSEVAYIAPSIAKATEGAVKA